MQGYKTIIIDNWIYYIKKADDPHCQKNEGKPASLMKKFMDC